MLDITWAHYNAIMDAIPTIRRIVLAKPMSSAEDHDETIKAQKDKQKYDLP